MANQEETDAPDVASDLSDDALEEAGRAMLAELGHTQADRDPDAADPDPAAAAADDDNAKATTDNDNDDNDDDDDGDDGDAPEPSDSERGKNPDFEPSEERKNESLDALWAAWRRKNKETKERERELDAQRAELDRQRAEVEQQRAWAEKMRESPLEGFQAYARANGLDPVQLYREMTEQQMGDGDGSAPSLVKRQLEEMRKEQERWRKEQQEAQQRAQQQQQQAFLRQRIDEVMSVRSHESLAKMYPHLASMPEARLQQEVTDSIIWFAQNDPSKLNDPVELAATLENAAKIELESWSEARKRYLSRADAEPAQSAETGDGRPAKPAPDKSRTLTNTAESGHGGARELDDDERFERAGKLAAKLLQIGE